MAPCITSWRNGHGSEPEKTSWRFLRSPSLNKIPDRIPDRLLKLASPKELKAYERLLRSRAALNTPLDYGLYVRDDLKPYRHTAYLNNVVLALVEDRLYKSGPGPASVERNGRRVHPKTGEPVLDCAMVSMPPQHGKSTLLSGLTPAWHLSNFPDLPVIFVTHTGDYAEKYGKENRDYIEAHPELGIRISQDSGAKDYFEIEGHRGYMLSVGVGSNRVTGRKGKLIVMDDMIGSEEDAQSPRFREKLLEYWYARLRTRRMRGTKYLYVGTRWVYNDFPGHIQKVEPDRWFVVNLPALAFDTIDDHGNSIDPDTGKLDPLGRKPGEALCEDLHPKQDLEQLRSSNPTWFVPLYQGRPTMAEGALFRTFSYYHLSEHGYHIGDEVIPEAHCVRYGIVDTATSTKTSSDYTVFGVFDLLPNSKKVILRHIIRERIPGDKHREWIMRWHQEYKCAWTGIERSPYTESLIQEMQRAGEPVRPLPNKNKDKYTRARPAADAINNGNLLLPAYASWKEIYEDELRQFDKGEHDDQVDVTAYGWTASIDEPRQRVSTEPTEPDSMDSVLARLAEKQLTTKVQTANMHPEVGLW